MRHAPDIPMSPAGKREPILFPLLRRRDEQSFSARCADNRSLNENDGEFTYLQYACKHNLLQAAEALLANGADPNLTCRPDQCSPIMLAGKEGHLNVVKVLALNSKVNHQSTEEGTVLHAVLDGVTKTNAESSQSSVRMRRLYECLQHLFTTVPSTVLDVNAQNKDGHTALHLAIKLHEKNIIRLLLDEGAYIGSRCNRGNMTISLINAKMFEEYLDSCIEENNTLPIDDNYELTFKYGFLKPPTTCSLYANGRERRAVSEIEPLIELSRVPELRPLLKHPVLTSFLNLKWFTIRKYFWVNFTFYLAFWLCLTIHTLVVYSPYDQRSITERRDEHLAICTWYPSLVLCGLFALRELFQFGVSPTWYLCDLENILDSAVLVLNVLILFCTVEVEFAAVTVLLTWIELVLLINRHPSLSTNMEMYKAVGVNFLKLLAWCSMLIVAFAISFHLLFKDTNGIINAENIITDSSTTSSSIVNVSTTEQAIIFQKFPKRTYNRTTANNTIAKKATSVDSSNETNDSNPQIFDTLGTSFFKVILMMTGEFDANDIPFNNSHPWVSRPMFVLFVFLITIVLFNLMNGLAVSDTQAIRSDAEIVGNVSRAKLIAYIEKMAAANPLSCLNICEGVTCNRCCITYRRARKRQQSTWRKPIRKFYKNVNLFPYVLPDSNAHVLPNLDNLVDIPDQNVKERRRRSHAKNSCWGGSCQKYMDWYISSGIMNRAKEIVEERKDKEERELCSNSMKKYSEKLEEYGRRLTALEAMTNEKLNEVIRLLKKSSS